jgi:hypothetical protein
MKRLTTITAALGLAAGSLLATARPAQAIGGLHFDETVPTPTNTFTTVGRPLVGDFDGNGSDDIFWYRPGPEADVIWFGVGAGRNFGVVARPVGGTYTPLVGDFDGNGVDDVFWYAPGTAADSVWFFDRAGRPTPKPFTVNGNYRPVVGWFDENDADHITRSDIFWYGPGSQIDSLWSGRADRTFDNHPQTIGGDYQLLVGAFTPNNPGVDGSTDGTLDIFFYQPGPTPDPLWKGDGKGNFFPRTYNVNGTYRPFVGLFDGYGVDDIFWYAPGAAADSVWLADPNSGLLTPHATSVTGTYTPVTGPFRLPDEPIVWHTDAGPDSIWYPDGEPGTWSRTIGPWSNTEFASPRTPIVGDFDGDHGNDILWFGPGALAEVAMWGPPIVPPT